MSGQVQIAADIYAPGDKATMSGQVDLSGSLVTNEAYLSGQVKIHYDVRLGNPSGGSNGVSEWFELVESTDKISLDAYYRSSTSG